VVEEDLDRAAGHRGKHERRLLRHGEAALESERVDVERKAPLDITDEKIGGEFGEMRHRTPLECVLADAYIHQPGENESAGTGRCRTTAPDCSSPARYGTQDTMSAFGLPIRRRPRL